MSEGPGKPRELKLLCIAFFFWSALTLAENISRWSITTSSGLTDSGESTYTLPVDLGVFGFLASIGLWRFSRAGRIFALVLTWYWLIGSVLLFFQVFPTKYLWVGSETDFLASVPQSFLRAFVIPFFLVQLWQLRTLNRPDIRALFRRPAKQPIV